MTNWKMVKKEYIIDGAKIQQIANRHGISENTIRKKATQEQWFKEKKEVREMIAYSDNFNDLFHMIMAAYLNRNIEYQSILNELKENSSDSQEEIQQIFFLENQIANSLYKMITSALAFKKIIEDNKEENKNSELTDEIIKQITKEVYGL